MTSYRADSFLRVKTHNMLLKFLPKQVGISSKWSSIFVKFKSHKYKDRECRRSTRQEKPDATSESRRAQRSDKL